MQQIHPVSPEMEGLTLQQALYAVGYTRRQIRDMKRADGIRVSGQPRFANRPVHSGEEIVCTLPSFTLYDPIPAQEDLPVPEILYQDELLCVAFKPRNLLVHKSPDSRSEMTMQDWLMQYFRVPVHAVHRLDAETEGLLVFAFLPYAQSRLQRLMAEGYFEKRYDALVFGTLPPEGFINAPIERIVPGSFTRAIRLDGKNARTLYQRTDILDGGRCSRVSLQLFTGRTHQLRVHLHYLGHPILGDPRYTLSAAKTYEEEKGIDRLCLCATSLSFPHPVTGERLSFEHLPSF